jgi:hypothetical protein
MWLFLCHFVYKSMSMMSDLMEVKKSDGCGNGPIGDWLKTVL